MENQMNQTNTERERPVTPEAGDIGRVLAEFLNNLQGNQGDNRNVNNRVLEQFRTYQPPIFNGRDGPEVVEEWFCSLERIYRMINSNDAQKITCATFQLVKDVDHWWEGVWSNMPAAEKNALTWEDFKSIIMNKLFPQSYKDMKEIEFLNLQQGSQSVTIYERKFNELCRFSPHLVDTDLKKALRFRRGLRAQLAGIMAAQGDLEYVEIVKRAEDVEASLGIEELRPKTTCRNDKRRQVDDAPIQDKMPKIEEDKRVNNQTRKPRCKHCGKYHFGNCFAKQDKCFKCQQTGHYSHKCPQLNSKLDAPRRKRLQRN